MNKKLNINQKVDMVLSRQKSLRDIAAKHGIHHSCVDDIFKESEKILSDYWQEKSKHLGRPRKAEELRLEEQKQLREDELSKELKLRQMRIDWLELQLKFASEREQEENRPGNKQLKKKKKKK